VAVKQQNSWAARLSPKIKVAALGVITALVVAFVRYNISHDRTGIIGLLLSWLVHFILLVVFSAIAGALILVWSKFYLGEDNQITINDFVKIQYFIYMPLLLAAVAIGFASGYVPSEYDD
jgi:hypothetical protein